MEPNRRDQKSMVWCVREDHGTAHWGEDVVFILMVAGDELQWVRRVSPLVARHVKVD